jgi:hypothetical protein
MSIKLFEDFTNNELYKKVSFDEWKEKAYDDYPVYQKLSKIEKTWITNKIEPSGGWWSPDPRFVIYLDLPVPIEIKWDVTWTRGEIKTNIKRVPKYNLYISKTSDDWFIVEYRHKLDDSEYYICDQFDGLKEFFKDVMNIQ